MRTARTSAPLFQWRRALSLAAGLAILLAWAPADAGLPVHRELLIPIVGVTVGTDAKPTGTVANLILSFDQRDDHTGLALHFRSWPGRFSPMAQTAVKQAIYRSARAAGLSPDSWTVVLSVPEPGLTVYGESLSAMVGLSVIALAKGDSVAPGRVLTGTVTPDGRIAPVGSLSLKVDAANQAHLQRVIVPDALDPADGDWSTPFMLQVSPVGSVSQAYQALTDRPLRP